MFIKSNSAFLLILKFCLDPWKNRNDIILIVNITFKRFRFLWVQQFQQMNVDKILCLKKNIVEQLAFYWEKKFIIIIELSIKLENTRFQ
jgi:hypothetical protein